MADEKGNLNEHSSVIEQVPGQTPEQQQIPEQIEYQSPVAPESAPEEPNFGLPSEYEPDEVPQVEEIPQEQQAPTESAVEYEPQFTSENYGSKENAEKALILESLINHGVKLDDASDEMNRVLGLSADFKE